MAEWVETLHSRSTTRSSIDDQDIVKNFQISTALSNNKTSLIPSIRTNQPTQAFLEQGKGHGDEVTSSTTTAHTMNQRDPYESQFEQRIVCYRCGEEGHQSNQCPQRDRRTVNLALSKDVKEENANYHKYASDDEEDEDLNEEVPAKCPPGESLMVQRLICTPKVNESSQCNTRNIAIIPMKNEKSPKALKVEGHSFLSIKDFVKESMDEE
ncbi:hypothetical protein QJS04_geneDACA021327 [Acorus gramineus]|uniref:CCHC-type domain-containing protein n=1 Tax=Acorus gramineus TaxID=55184 RepID=A0AAV9BLG1_ACOGR|nr:hypothetical protein QJS04_geneDACA021327 [Acorus gramineus]